MIFREKQNGLEIVFDKEDSSQMQMFVIIRHRETLAMLNLMEEMKVKR